MKLKTALFLAFMVAVFGAAHAQQSTTIKVYSATDTSAIKAVIDAFEIINPAVKVSYLEFNTRELYEIILKGVDDVDLVISSSMDLQTDLVNRGDAFPFSPPNANELPSWSNWLSSLYGFTYEPVAMVYNKAAFSGRKLPETRSQLAAMIRDDPAFFNGRVGTYDIALSGVGYMFATQDALRDVQFSRVIESFGRAEAKTYCCTSEVTDRVANGELVFGYNVIGSYALAAAQNDDRLGITLFSDYALVMSRSAFIAKSSTHKDEAALFISFLLSKEGQAIIAEKSALLPLDPETHTSPTVSLLKSSKALLPIRLGPGLLTYLDQIKRTRFLRDWESSMVTRPSDAKQ